MPPKKFAKNDDPKQPYIYKYLKKNEEKEISPKSSMSTSSQTGFVHKIVHKIRPKKNSPNPPSFENRNK